MADRPVRPRVRSITGVKGQASELPPMDDLSKAQRANP